jgi:FkbM family methyltransferase
MQAEVKQNWKGWLVSNAMSLAGWTIKQTHRGNIPIGGLSINVTRAPISAKIVYQLSTNAYERPEREAIRRYLNPNLTTVELGASIGVVTCVLRHTLSPGARLISVEANPRLMEQVNYNLYRNGLNSKVIVINYAIAYNTRVAHLQLSDQTTSGRIANSTSNQQDLVIVPAITLTDLLEKYEVEDYTLVSDIEGGEYDFLLRDAAALERCKQIIIELHNSPQASIDELNKYIRETLSYELLFRDGSVFVYGR